MTQQMRSLCEKYTHLTKTDIQCLEQVTLNLHSVADLTGNDIFIDALTDNGVDSIVLAWAKPPGPSIYSKSVVGELAYKDNEPGVYRSMTTGESTRDIRGISQEGVPIAQTVVPLFNAEKKVIGVLIMERNIAKELQQEEKVEFLSSTAEKLSSTLMSLSLKEKNFEDWVGNGLFVLNKQGKITYANKNATAIYRKYCSDEALGSSFFALMPTCATVLEVLECCKNSLEIKRDKKFYRFQAYPLIIEGQLSGCVISIQDLTDLKQKEQALNTQSMIIREIHHRVKNNLQNIAAVLRLQMRRSQSEVVKFEFEASINRIMAIALVHEACAVEMWDSINFNEFCTKILNLLIESSGYSANKVITSVDGPPMMLYTRQAIPLALVINELVTNSIKHGISPLGYGEIAICYSENNGMINLSVSDSGAEQEGQSLAKKGLGMQIVESLIHEELEGYFRFERKDGTARAMVCFPRYSREDSE